MRHSFDANLFLGYVPVINDLLLIAGSHKTTVNRLLDQLQTHNPVLDELIRDGDYLTDKFADTDLDSHHNLSKDILDYNTNVTEKMFNTSQTVI